MVLIMEPGGTAVWFYADELADGGHLLGLPDRRRP